MDIKGKSVLVIGGWGLVGSSVCRKFMEHHPKRIIVTSLLKQEALEAVEQLKVEYPHAGKKFFVPWWGNIFVRHQLKDLPREKILASAKYREMIIEDIVDELSPAVLKRSSLHYLMQQYKPDIVVDCVNSATGIAYQDIFQVSREVLQQIRAARKGKGSEPLAVATERLLCTLYVPQLIRHVQLMYRSMRSAASL